MTEKLSRHPQKSTEELKGLDDSYGREHAAIMRAENLTPPAKRERLEALRKDYRERWIQAKAQADKDLEEWSEVYQARADSAHEP